MRDITATAPALHSDAGLAAPLATDHPQYRHVGSGKFEPANDAAWIECRRWNEYADAWNARTTGRSSGQ